MKDLYSTAHSVTKHDKQIYRLVNGAASASGCASPLWWAPVHDATQSSPVKVHASDEPMIRPPNPGEELPQPRPVEIPIETPKEIPRRDLDELKMLTPMIYKQVGGNG